LKDAQAAYCAVLMQKNTDLTAKVDELAKKTEAKPPVVGAAPAANVIAGQNGGESQTKDWLAERKLYAMEHKITVSAAIRLDPEGHKKWLDGIQRTSKRD